MGYDDAAFLDDLNAPAGNSFVDNTKFHKLAGGKHVLRFYRSGVDETLPAFTFYEHFISLTDRPICSKTFGKDMPCAICDAVNDEIALLPKPKDAGDDKEEKDRRWKAISKVRGRGAKKKAWLIAAVAERVRVRDADGNDTDIWEFPEGDIQFGLITFSGPTFQTVLDLAGVLGGHLGNAPALFPKGNWSDQQKADWKADRTAFMEKVVKGMPALFGNDGYNVVVDVDPDAKGKGYYTFRLEEGETLNVRGADGVNLQEMFKRIKRIDDMGEQPGAANSGPSAPMDEPTANG